MASNVDSACLAKQFGARCASPESFFHAGASIAGLLSEMLASPRFVATTFITFWSAANLQLWLREKKGSLCFRDGMCRQKWQQARRDM